jgi:WD40 repeat protein/transcriptional regulator with XRE-family HTH domain
MAGVMGDPHDVEMADDTPEARFGAELRRLRVQAGLSVRRLAQELHRAHSGIVHYESGRRLPGVEVVEQYEDFFGLGRGTLGAQRERARVQRLESPPDATVDEHLGDVVCPYKGLRPFEHDDAALFYGRETQVEEGLERLAEVRFVAVVGASGSGKSSFVRAGLLASVKAAPSDGAASTRVVLLTPGEHPVDELASAVSAAYDGAAGLLADDLRADPSQLERGTRHASAGGLVIAVDQFEELFTLCRDDAERRCFVDALMATWRDIASPVAVIVALRADFYGHVAAYSQLAAAVVAHQTLVGPMSPTDLRRAIELPAGQTGLLLQPGLVDTILEDLADEPGALPLLSHALLETCKRRRRLMLTVAGYRDAGGVRGAIAQTAERTLQMLPETDRAVARSVFLSLTEIGEGAQPTRRRVDRAELVTHARSPDVVDRVLGVLADARLVSIEERTVVVAHEALIRYWPRLRGWIDADRAGLLIHRRLTDAARQWDALKREPAALYRGTRLAESLEWCDAHAPSLSDLEHAFLAASEASRARADETRRRRRRLTAATLVTLAAAAVAIVVAVLFVSRERDIAASQDLARKSSALIETDPGLALAIALEALRGDDGEQAQNALRQATLAHRATRVIKAHPGLVYGVAPSPDGRLAATAGGDRSVGIWNVRSGDRVGKIAGYRGEVRAVAFSRDGKQIASAAHDGEIAVAAADGGRRHVVMHLKDDFAISIAFGTDAKTLAIGTYNGRVALLRLRDRALRDLGPREAGPVYGVSFDRDARRLISAGADGVARIWKLSGGAPVKLADHNKVFAASFSPDNAHVATIDESGDVLLWDARHGDRPTRIQVTDQPLTSVRFSSDGRRIVSADIDGALYVVAVREHAVLAELKGHKGPARADFVPNSSALISAGEEDGTLRTWTAPATRIAKRPGEYPRFSRDSALVVAGDVNGPIHIWNPATEEERLLVGHTQPSIAQFSPDASQIVSASHDQTVRLWDVNSAQSQIVPTLGGLKYAAALDATGKRVAIGGATPLVIQAVDGSHRLRLRGHLGYVNEVVFSADSQHLLTGSDDATARVWNARSGTLERTLRGHEGPVHGVSYSDDGQRIATAGSDGTVRIWDTSSGNAVILVGHEGPVNTAEFNAHGDRVVSAGDDGTIRIWDTSGGGALVVLYKHEGVASGADFSADGHNVISAGDDGMRITACEVCGTLRDTLRVARTRAPHKLSPAERQRLLPTS